MKSFKIVSKEYYKCPECGKLIQGECSCGYVRGTMTKDEKAKFRKTMKWKNFRKKIKEKCPRDTITKKLLRIDWNLHHIDMRDKNYTDLSDPHKFTPLNKDTHEMIHWLFRLYRHDKQIIKRIEKLLEAMYRYVEEE